MVAHSKISMNWTGVKCLTLQKTKNVWKTLIKDYLMQQIYELGIDMTIMFFRRRSTVFICDIGQIIFYPLNV